jgi:hypothetical protein
MRRNSLKIARIAGTTWIDRRTASVAIIKKACTESPASESIPRDEDSGVILYS